VKRFQTLWVKNEQKERLFSATMFGHFIAARELGRLITLCIHPEPKISFISEPVVLPPADRKKRRNRRISRTRSLDQIEGLDKLDSKGNTKAVSLWATNDILQWLESVGLERYFKYFVAKDVKGLELLLMDEEALQRLGVKRKEHRDLMLQSLALMPASESTLSRSLSNRSLRTSASVLNLVPQPNTLSAPVLSNKQ